MEATLPQQKEKKSSLPDGAAQTLEGRLLCASHASYNISQPYFRGATYLPHTTAKRVSRSINSVLIGYTVDGIVLAFRGTIFDSALDWFQNAAVLLSPGDKKDGIPGSVHVGFYRAVKSLWKGVKSVLLQFLQDHSSPYNNNETQNVYLTGHSKGGALATLAALLMHNDASLPNPTSVITFGSARVGDKQFKVGYESLVKQITFENDLDIIPFLPLSNTDREFMNEKMKDKMDSMLWPKNTKNQKYKWGYQPIGQRKYIQFDNSTYTILDDTDGAYDAERVRKFEEKTFLKYEEFIEAHRSDCEGGYFRAIAPEVCVETKDDVVAIQDEEEYTWMVKEDVAFELEEDAMVTTAIAI
mmetsp:Transcript_5656/g.8426  ORF Transcript_5656/g.8426 Transcript_5656/m.8426 type:complete len:356 (-) Transcript_5656:35-1102(-)